MNDKVVPLEGDALGNVYDAADKLSLEDIESGDALFFKHSVINAAEKGIVSLDGLFTYLVSGGDSSYILNGLASYLDKLEETGMPELQYVADGYLRQLSIKSDSDEGKPLVDFCKNYNTYLNSAKGLSENAVRTAHEMLHLSFILTYSTSDHQEIESNLNLASHVIAGCLLNEIDGNNRRELVEKMLPLSLGQESLDILETFYESFNKTTLRKAYDSVDESELPYEQKENIIAGILLSDVVDMQRCQYLKRDYFLMADPISVCGELLTPADNMEFLHNILNELDYQEDNTQEADLQPIARM